MTGAEDELTPAQAADILGVSTATVRRYEEATPTRGPLLIPRRLPGSGYRRYLRADVEWLRDHPEATGPRTGADPALGEDGGAGSAGK